MHLGDFRPVPTGIGERAVDIKCRGDTCHVLHVFIFSRIISQISFYPFIMRFSALIAFMLALSALAVPFKDCDGVLKDENYVKLLARLKSPEDRLLQGGTWIPVDDVMCTRLVD